MTPIKPELYDYSFDRSVISSLRTKLKLNQAKFAELLDIPINTLSRWESGATTPDADTLGAIYSIAKKHGIAMNFFRRRLNVEQVAKRRTKLVLAWDYQNLAFELRHIPVIWSSMKSYLDLTFPATKASRMLRVYASMPVPNYLGAFNYLHDPPQPTVKTVFEELKFEVHEGYYDADSQIVQDSLKECSVSPQKTVFILVSKDGDYAVLLRELRKLGVEVYVWSDEKLISEALKAAIESENLINLNRPYVVGECVSAIKELAAKPIKRGNFGQYCRERLEANEVFPQDVGFSHRNPYGSLLDWLERQDIVEIKTEKEPDLISIKLKR